MSLDVYDEEGGYVGEPVEKQCGNCATWYEPLLGHRCMSRAPSRPRFRAVTIVIGAAMLGFAALAVARWLS